MNLVDFRIEPNSQTIGDFILFGEITDDLGNVIGTFGPDGTSIFVWWSQQTTDFQLIFVNQFSGYMARQIAYGDVA